MNYPHFNASETAKSLSFSALLAALRIAVADYANEKIHCPERFVIPLPEEGIMLSMPVIAPDLAVHKLVNICPNNAQRAQPTLQGQITAYDATTGTPLFMLDAPTVTVKRTAAISLLGIELLHHPPQHVTIIGTGQQALGHIQALQAIHPHTRITVLGRTLARATSFTKQFNNTICAADTIPDDADVVITTTNSKTPVYHEQPRVGRLVIGVGTFTADAAELSPSLIKNSQLFIDNPVGAQHEAGDFILAGVNWTQIHPLAKALYQPPDQTQPIVFKSVGCAAWDLAACQVFKTSLNQTKTIGKSTQSL